MTAPPKKQKVTFLLPPEPDLVTGTKNRREKAPKQEPNFFPDQNIRSILKNKEPLSPILLGDESAILSLSILNSIINKGTANFVLGNFSGSGTSSPEISSLEEELESDSGDNICEEQFNSSGIFGSKFNNNLRTTDLDDVQKAKKKFSLNKINTNNNSDNSNHLETETNNNNQSTNNNKYTSDLETQCLSDIIECNIIVKDPNLEVPNISVEKRETKSKFQYLENNKLTNKFAKFGPTISENKNCAQRAEKGKVSSTEKHKFPLPDTTSRLPSFLDIQTRNNKTNKSSSSSTNSTFSKSEFNSLTKTENSGLSKSNIPTFSNNTFCQLRSNLQQLPTQKRRTFRIIMADAQNADGSGQPDSLTPSMRDDIKEKGILIWIYNMIDEPARVDYEFFLKDGCILCKLMNRINPDCIPEDQITWEGVKSKQKNIGMFLDVAEKYGVPQAKLFHMEDLLQLRHIPRVTRCIYALAKLAQDDPALGPDCPRLGDEPSFVTATKRPDVPGHRGTKDVLSQITSNLDKKVERPVLGRQHSLYK